MLLGYRVSSKSILWPLIVVMLPGWLVLVSLIRRPEASWHTQMALRERLAQQLLACDYAAQSDDAWQGRSSLPERTTKITSLLEQAERAGFTRDPQLVDESLAWLRLGDHDRAAATLARLQHPETASHYLPLVQKAVQGLPPTTEDEDKLRELLRTWPRDWWLTTLAQWLHVDQTLDLAALDQQRHASWWRLRIVDAILPLLGVLSVLLALPALRLLRGTWTVWPYSERVQHLWPVPLMLLVVSLRGLFMLLAGSIAGIVVPLISWAGQHDPITVYHIQTTLGFVFNMIVTIALTYGVKEAVAPRWGTLQEVLGFEGRELSNARLWAVAFPCAAGLMFALEPLPQWLEHWHLGGTSLYDSLSRSPGGYSGPATVISVLQAVLVAPVIEEIIYRGFLLSALRNQYGRTAGVIVSSIIFALANGCSLTGTLIAFTYGAAYACLKLHTGRLGTAMIMHGCVNAVVTVIALVQGG